MDRVFTVKEDNSLGFYNAPIQKIMHIIRKYVEKSHAQTSETIKLKISIDGLQLTNTHRTILNVTFTILNENKRATTSRGNYILGLFEIESENYDEVNTALREILEPLKTLTTIQEGSSVFNVKKSLGGDLKCLAYLYGINAAQSTCPCVWCEFNVLRDSNADGSWLISRTIARSKELLDDNTLTAADRVGYARKPIIDFIEFDCCVVDTLHMFLRISENLLKTLFVILNESDNLSTADLSMRVNLGAFFNFLKNECKICNPYYVKIKENGEAQYKLRSLNSNELEKMFFKLQLLDLITLLPHLKTEITGINFILNEFFNIYKLISCGQRPFYSIEEIEKRLKEWATVYTQIGAFNSNKFTPYIHIFLHHIPQFLRLYGEINSYNCQGLEKLNHLIKCYYFSNSNKNDRIYLKQLLVLRNRIEFAELDGTLEEMDTMSAENRMIQELALRNEME